MQKHFLLFSIVVVIAALPGCASVYFPWQHSAQPTGEKNAASISATKYHLHHSISSHKNISQEIPTNDGTPIQNLMA